MVTSTSGLNRSSNQSVVRKGDAFCTQAKQERGGLTMQLPKNVNVLGVKYKVKLQSRLIENENPCLA